MSIHIEPPSCSSFLRTSTVLAPRQIWRGASASLNLQPRPRGEVSVVPIRSSKPRPAPIPPNWIEAGRNSVLGGGRFHLVAMAADPAATREVDVFALGDALAARGWYHDRQGPPDSLHSTVSNTNAGVIDSYLADLATCVGEVAGTRTDDRSTTYATLE